MEGLWDTINPIPVDSPPREYQVSVELYISNAAGANLRKPAPERKKPDKRGSAGNVLREKSSLNWIPMHKGLSSAGQWRAATCRLMEEDDRCLLKIYVDDSILYQTISVHLLSQTDIRQTDNSMFYRKDCLGIFAIAGQRWTPSNTVEPLYLQFFNADICFTWKALLKSYAIPEIYGRWFFPTDGGSYRMWRQVELTVIQGRNLGQPRYDSGGHALDKDELESVDTDISCEVHVNDILSSRTTVKKGASAPEWHEAFTFSELAPFEYLEIVVWKEKKLAKPLILGRTRINLGNFRRGDTVDGWFPVVQPGLLGSEVQSGELRLKVRVDEEIILPQECYVKLMKTCNSRNFLDWISDLESRLKLKTISFHLMAVAVAKNVDIEQIQEYATREVGNATSQQTLFRGNTTLTKTVELCMTWYGKAFLEASIGTVMRKLVSEKVAIEVDPMRLNGKSPKEMDRSVGILLHWCELFWVQIYSARFYCPTELRRVFNTIRKLVEQRYKPEQVSTNPDMPVPNHLPWQSVSAFCFLRFIVPAILHPHLFGLTQGLPPPAVQRSLTLIAKVIQSLANLNSNMQKEAYMKGVQVFLKDSVPAMMDYISVVSTPTDTRTTSNMSDSDRHDRLTITTSLNQRKKLMNVLDREAIPSLPHLLDVSKHVAIITSAVIRSSRELSSRPRTGDDTDLAVDEFCSRCFEVEEEALLRVSQLATKLASDDPIKRPSYVASDPGHDEPSRSPIPSSQITTTITSAGQPSPRQRKLSRPATAPGQSVHASPLRHNFASPVHLVQTATSPRAFTHVLPDDERSYSNHEHMPTHNTMAPHSPPLLDTDDAKKRKGLLRGILKR